jgi:YihY family inner membrane protein
MNVLERSSRAADRFQQRLPALAFPVAVWKKFSDDQAGNLAALIAYYAFAALFPLLLVLVTVLNIVLANHPGLRQQLVTSALSQYPVIGPQIDAHLGHISGTGLPLAIGAVLLLLGARGVANAMQNAMCEVWGIAREDRPGFPMSQVWAMALLLTVSIGFIATTFLSTLAGGAGQVLNGAGSYVGTVVVSLIVNFGMFWLGFRLATMFKVPWRDLRTGALIAAVCWQVLQVAGGYVVSHQLQRASQLYGTFGIVLGLMAWLFLQAEVTIYAAEADVVIARHLWPRTILDDTDKRDKSENKSDQPSGVQVPIQGKPAAPGGAARAREGEPSSLVSEPAANGQADAGARSSVPPQGNGPAGGDERAAGQR